MHIKAVADMLGHSSITITGDIYGHTSDDTARAAVDGWSGVLGTLSARIAPRRIPDSGLHSVHSSQERLCPQSRHTSAGRCTNTLSSYGSSPTPCPNGMGEYELLELSELMNIAADETPEKYKQ